MNVVDPNGQKTGSFTIARIGAKTKTTNTTIAAKTANTAIAIKPTEAVMPTSAPTNASTSASENAYRKRKEAIIKLQSESRNEIWKNNVQDEKLREKQNGLAAKSLEETASQNYSENDQVSDAF